MKRTYKRDGIEHSFDLKDEDTAKALDVAMWAQGYHTISDHKEPQTVSTDILSSAPVIPGNSYTPSVEHRSTEDIPLAGIPLSQLMGTTYCPSCGNILGNEVKEASYAGGVYLLCKNCSTIKR